MHTLPGRSDTRTGYTKACRTTLPAVKQTDRHSWRLVLCDPHIAFSKYSLHASAIVAHNSHFPFCSQRLSPFSCKLPVGRQAVNHDHTTRYSTQSVSPTPDTVFPINLVAFSNMRNTNTIPWHLSSRSSEQIRLVSSHQPVLLPPQNHFTFPRENQQTLL